MKFTMQYYKQYLLMVSVKLWPQAITFYAKLCRVIRNSLSRSKLESKPQKKILSINNGTTIYFINLLVNLSRPSSFPRPPLSHIK